MTINQQEYRNACNGVKFSSAYAIESLEFRSLCSVSSPEFVYSRAAAPFHHSVFQLPFKLNGAGVVTLGNVAILAGGVTGSGNDSAVTNSVEIFNGLNHTWSTAKLSQPQDDLAATTVGDTALFAGGMDVDNNPTALVDEYDGRTHRWSTAQLSQVRSDIAATTVGRLAMFAGGVVTSPTTVTSDVVDIYNGKTGTWSVAHLSQPRGGLGATTVGRLAIFAGGYDSTTDAESDVVDIFDGKTGTWSVTHLPAPRVDVVAVSVGHFALFAGGDIPSVPNSASDTVDIYDTLTNSWSTQLLSLPRFGMSATTVGPYAIFAGGTDSGMNFDDTVDVFDSHSGQWFVAHLATPRAGGTAFTIGNSAYFAGGSISPGDDQTRVIDAFTLDTSPPTAQLSSAATVANPAASYTFSVRYQDDLAVAPSSIGDKDILVSGPNGFSTDATAVSSTRGRHGRVRIVKYIVDAPINGWTAGGAYTITLNANAIEDTAGNAAPGGKLGEFKVG